MLFYCWQQCLFIVKRLSVFCCYCFGCIFDCFWVCEFKIIYDFFLFGGWIGGIGLIYFRLIVYGFLDMCRGYWYVDVFYIMVIVLQCIDYSIDDGWG